MAKEIINWLDQETGWDEVVNEIKSRCNLTAAKYIAVKIVRDIGYRRKDAHAHVPNPSVSYVVIDTDNLSGLLDWLCNSEDYKNGCQLMQEDDGTYFFQITGQNFYDKENNYAGTDTVKVYFKEFVW